MSEINKRKINPIKKISVAIIFMVVIFGITTIAVGAIVIGNSGFKIDIVKSVAALIYIIYLVMSWLFFIVTGIIQITQCDKLPLAKKTIIISGILSIVGAFLMWIPILGWGLAIWLIVLNCWIYGEKDLNVKPKTVVEEVPEV